MAPIPPHLPDDSGVMGVGESCQELQDYTL